MAEDAARKPVPFRAGGLAPATRGWIAALSLVGVVGGLEVLAAWGLMGPLTFPAPSAIAQALADLHSSGLLWPHLGASLTRFAVGWSLGVGLGILIGVAIGIATWPRSLGIPWVAALSAIPKIALLPLFIIWFGIGEGSKYATIAFGCFFPTVISTFGGVDNVPRSLIRMGQSFNLRQATIVWHIILPATLPAILSGFRIAASVGVILLVAAEMVSARFGVGAYIIEQQNLFQLDRLMAGVVILMLFGLALHAAIGALERRLLRWR